MKVTDVHRLVQTSLLHKGFESQISERGDWAYKTSEASWQADVSS